jgi:trigger factor
MIKGQMAQFGQLNPSEEEIDGIVARVLGNQEEVKRLSEQLNTNKLLEYFKENAKLKTKEISYEKFIKEAYQ